MVKPNSCFCDSPMLFHSDELSDHAPFHSTSLPKFIKSVTIILCLIIAKLYLTPWISYSEIKKKIEIITKNANKKLKYQYYLIKSSPLRLTIFVIV